MIKSGSRINAGIQLIIVLNETQCVMTTEPLNLFLNFKGSMIIDLLVKRQIDYRKPLS